MRPGLLLFLALCLAGALPAAAAGAWAPLGPDPVNVASIALPTTGDAQETGIATVGGVPYVVWREFDGQNNEIRVARPNGAGTGWDEVVGGASPINHDPAENASFPGIAAVGGVPHVAWSESQGGHAQLRVARLNPAGTDWVELGGALNHDPNRDATASAITDVGGVPYVGWVEANGAAVLQLRVARPNAGGTGWDEVGAPLNHDPSRSAFSPSMTTIDGVPYVAWREADGSGEEVRVARLDAVGTAWEEVVGGASPIDRDPTASTSSPSIAGIGGTPHVAWIERTAVVQVRVARLDAAGTDWVELGGPDGINLDPSQEVGGVRLAAVGTVPFVTWNEFVGGAAQVRVARLDAAGTGWQEVVGGARPLDVAADELAFNPAIASVGGVPWVAWAERDGLVTKARAARLVPDFLSGGAAYPTSPTTALLVARVRTYGVAYPLAFELGAGGSFGTVTSLRATAGGARDEAVVVEVTGLPPAAQLSWRAFANDGLGRAATDAARTLTTPAAPATPSPAPPVPGPRPVVALVAATPTVVAGKRLAIAYFSTVDAATTLELRRKGKLVATLTGTAKPGRNTLTWATTARRKPLAPGVYAFTLAVTSADGQSATAAGTATLTAPKPKPKPRRG